MKTLFAIACLLFTACASFGASSSTVHLSTISTTAASLNDGVTEFFSKSRRAGLRFTLNEVIDGQMNDRTKATVFASSAGWVAELVKIEALAKDNPKDKRVVLEMRRTASALEKAQRDKSMAAEAVRALASLRASAK